MRSVDREPDILANLKILAGTNKDQAPLVAEHFEGSIDRESLAGGISDTTGNSLKLL